MSTLHACLLKKLNTDIVKADRDSLKAAAEIYMQRGNGKVDEQSAIIQAVEARIKELEKQYKRIERETVAAWMKENPDDEPNKTDGDKRYEAGSKLTKEERKTVLKTLTDVYRSKQAEKEERISANGETYLAYPHQPELFEKSDITGKMVRFYVTLPDGRIAHPTELFPDYSQSDVDRAISKQVDEERVADQNKKYRMETLNRRTADNLQDANRIFNKENPNRADYVPAILTNGKQFIRTAPENAAKDVELLGGDWRIQDSAERTEAKPADTPAKADQIRAIMGLDLGSIDAYDPAASVIKTGNRWAYITYEGNQHPSGFDTKREATENAQRHKELKQAQHKDPEAYWDVLSLLGQERSDRITRYMREGMSEMNAGKRAKDEVQDDWTPAVRAEDQKAKEKPTVPLSNVVDSVNKKFGKGLDYKDRIHTLAVHDDLFERMRNGEVSEDEFKASFNSLLNNEAALTAELGKMTKTELLSRSLPYWAKNEKKEKVVGAAYRAMLDDFVLGNSISWSMGEKYENVIQAYVDRTTEADIKKYAERYKDANEAAKERVEKFVEAIQDPKTLDDFITYLRAKIQDGATTFRQARMSMTPEQRAKFDELYGEKTRDERKARADQQKTDIRVAAQTTEGQVVETKHTKTGEPLFVVKAAERVERDVYTQWNATAKRLGGWYSAFRGNGAVPGFQFKTRENADAFLAYIGGNVEQVKDAVQTRRDSYQDDKSQSAVERLTEMADRLEERADESLGRDRKANTSRRAGFAASAEAAANSDKALAKTMRNIANAISEGKVKFLDRVRQKSQVEMLRGMVRDAQYDQLTAKYPSYAEQEKHRGEKPDNETADYSKFPSFTAYRSDLARLARELQATEGAKKLGDRLAKVANDVTDSYIKFAKENLNRVSTFKTNAGDAIFASKERAEEAINRSGFKGKAIVLPFKRAQNIIIQSPSAAKENGIWQGDDDKRITLTSDFGAEIVEKAKSRGIDRIAMPWVFDSANDKINRLKAIGIETPAELRAALREFISVQEQAAEPDKIKQMERAMIGRRNDGLDFFPTPAGVAREMVETADIKEGMTVLEPSAGMGHIAEQIREYGIEPDVVEMSGDRRELLTEKGFNLVGSDFMDVTGEYDRVVMNPPFSNRRDIEHVRHAYSLLKPGGRLVAIMGEGSFFGSDKKATEFRDWLDSLNGTSEKLDEGTFQDPTLPVNTGVNARMVVVDKPESAKFSQSTQPVSNPHTPTTLRTAIDKSEGQGFAARLEATGNFKIIGNDQVDGILTGGEKFAKAWHGTPHIWAPEPGFPHGRPRLDKMGTGEGAQAYGWGWYSAESNGVAKSYAEKLSDDLERYFVNGEEVLSRKIKGPAFDVTDPRTAAIIYGGTDGKMAAKKYFAKQGKWGIQAIQELEKLGDIERTAPGQLYQLDIPDASLPYLLDWDRPLSEQTPEVMKSIAEGIKYVNAKSRKQRGANITSMSDTAKSFYAKLAGLLPDDAKEASEYLASIGIVGNRYLDGQSRNVGDVLYRVVSDSKAFVSASFDTREQADKQLAGYIKHMPDARIEEFAVNKSYNYVLWDQPTLDKVAMLERNGEKLDAMRESEVAEIRYSKDGNILAFVKQGVVYMVADNISQSDNVPGLLRHEISAHALQLGKSDAEFQAILKQVEQSPDPKVKAARARVPDDTPAHLVTEETLGYLLEYQPNHSIAKRFLSWFRAQVRKLAGVLKGLERMKFMQWANKLSVDDLVWMANKALKTAPETLGKANREGMFKADTQRWYSPLLKAFRDAKQETMPAAQWGLWINANKAKYGLKDDEIQWSGILDYLAIRGKDKVTKGEIADYMSGNGVKVEDVVKGDPYKDITMPKENVATRIYGMAYADLPQETRDDIDRTFKDRVVVDKTKFSGYWDSSYKGGIPGTYREILVTLPERTAADESAFRAYQSELRQKYGTDLAIIEDGTAEENAKLESLGMAITDANKKSTPFKSSHWYEPNVLVHLRTDEVLGAYGKRYLRVGEIQSDWGQQRKKEDGYRSRGVADGGNGAPAAPFVTDTKSWVALGIKRAIIHAVESGADGVVFGTGQQNADLYDLSKQVDYIDYVKSAPGRYNMAVVGKNGDEVFSENAITIDRIEEVVGKDVATKIANGEGKSGGGRMTLSGLDLKVGGEGMRAFYDKIVPQVANDVLKKLGGGKVGTVSTHAPDNRPMGGGAVMRLDDDAQSVQPGFAITPEIRTKLRNEGMPLFSKRTVSDTVWSTEPISKMDTFLYEVTDKQVDTKRVIEAIKKQGKEIADKWNTYIQEALYHGRTAKKTDDFLHDEAEPLIKKMADAKVTQDELNDYLHARHAIERNRVMKERNPDREDNEGLSGMSDDKAKDILSKANPALKEIAKDIDAILVKTRKELVSYGLETQDTVDAWASLYQNYVPLKREGFEDRPGTGMGFAVRGSSTKEATGSHRAVDNILANIAMQRERAIVRGEKNRVAMSLYGLAKQFPNSNFWKLDKPAQITQINPDTGLPEVVAGDLADYKVPRIKYIGKDGTVQERVDPNYKGRNNVMTVRINGEDRAILFNDQEPRAMRMVEALKNLDADQLGEILGGIGQVTRYIASVNTQYNPVFGVVNLIRDVQTAALNLTSTELKGKQKEVFSQAFGALKGIYQDARAVRDGKHPTSTWSKLWEDFQSVGGQTGYRQIFATSKDRADAIEQLLDPTWWQKGKFGKVITLNGILAKPEQLLFDKVGKHVFQWLSDYNLAMENSIRLASYKVGIESGMTKEKAAFLAKNLTVNFNKKGRMATQAGALYAFFNASAQGTARIAETLNAGAKDGAYLGSVGKKIVYGGITLGAMQAIALMMAGFDDDEPPEFVRERNLIIPAPGTEKGYITIPMPLGFHVLPNIGRTLVEGAVYGKPLDRMTDLLMTMLEAFNPIGTGASMAQTISPTVFDPVIALSENKDWTGKQIYREDFSKTNPTPGFTRSKDVSNVFSTAIAEAINTITGGTDYKPGRFSPTPDQISYLITQATGGVGREVDKTLTSLGTVASGEDLPMYKVPLVGRLVGTSADNAAIRDKFYDNVKMLNMHEAEIKGRRENREPTIDYIKDNPESRLVSLASSVESDVRKLQKRKKQLMEDGKSDAVKMVDMQIASKMKRLNDRVNEVQK